MAWEWLIECYNLARRTIHEQRTEDYSIFSYNVVPTYDFIQELRKHGPYLEVLEPTDLRELFMQDLQEGMKLYKKMH